MTGEVDNLDDYEPPAVTAPKAAAVDNLDDYELPKPDGPGGQEGLAALQKSGPPGPGPVTPGGMGAATVGYPIDRTIKDIGEPVLGGTDVNGQHIGNAAEDIGKYGDPGAAAYHLSALAPAVAMGAVSMHPLGRLAVGGAGIASGVSNMMRPDASILDKAKGAFDAAGGAAMAAGPVAEGVNSGRTMAADALDSGSMTKWARGKMADFIRPGSPAGVEPGASKVFPSGRASESVPTGRARSVMDQVGPDMPAAISEGPPIDGASIRSILSNSPQADSVPTGRARSVLDQVGPDMPSGLPAEPVLPAQPSILSGAPANSVPTGRARPLMDQVGPDMPAASAPEAPPPASPSLLSGAHGSGVPVGRARPIMDQIGPDMPLASPASMRRGNLIGSPQPREAEPAMFNDRTPPTATPAIQRVAAPPTNPDVAAQIQAAGLSPKNAAILNAPARMNTIPVEPPPSAPRGGLREAQSLSQISRLLDMVQKGEMPRETAMQMIVSAAKSGKRIEGMPIGKGFSRPGSEPPLDMDPQLWNDAREYGQQGR